MAVDPAADEPSSPKRSMFCAGFDRSVGWLADEEVGVEVEGFGIFFPWTTPRG